MRLLPLILFLIINFGALGLGAWLMGEGPSSEWYQSANQAPWTPPGWVFGAAWTFIMMCYSIYMARAWSRVNRGQLASFFGVQLLLNIGWNPVFFFLHDAEMGLLIIAALTILIWAKVFIYLKKMKGWNLLLLPYSIWLTIATSLNWYFLLNN